MAHTHYVDLMIREGEIAHDLFSRLLLALHHRNVAGGGLAIAWPDWRSRPGEFGLLCRVFGDEVQLAAYLDYVEPLVAANLVRAYPVTPVPETERKVRFVRDRSHDKLSPSAARRLAARASARGEVWVSAQDGKPRKAGDHYLAIQSASKAQAFRLYIRRDEASKSDPTGANYGLGYVLPNF